MPERLLSLGAVRRLLEVSGERPHFTGRGLELRATVHDREASLQIEWEPAPGVVFVFLVMPVLWNEEASRRVEAAVTSLNNTLPAGALMIWDWGREVLVCASHIFMAHDGSVGQAEVSRSLDLVRTLARQYLPRVEALLT